jgi:hypothetical protein
VLDRKKLSGNHPPIIVCDSFLKTCWFMIKHMGDLLAALRIFNYLALVYDETHGFDRKSAMCLIVISFIEVAY